MGKRARAASPKGQAVEVDVAGCVSPAWQKELSGPWLRCQEPPAHPRQELGTGPPRHLPPSLAPAPPAAFLFPSRTRWVFDGRVSHPLCWLFRFS